MIEVTELVEQPQDVSPRDAESRAALHEAMLLHLEAEGVSSALMRELRAELHSDSKSDSVRETELLQLFRFATEGLLRVAVSTLGGGLCELDVDGATTVAELKRSIEACAGIP